MRHNLRHYLCLRFGLHLCLLLLMNPVSWGASYLLRKQRNRPTRVWYATESNSMGKPQLRSRRIARAVDNSLDGLSEHNQVCHSHHLYSCGSDVIRQLTSGNESVAPNKCKIREEFLDCMLEQRRIGCISTDEERQGALTPEETTAIRSQVKSLLWSQHGCILL